MRIEPHARDPDDDPSDRDDRDDLESAPAGNDAWPLDERVADHQAAFVPPRGKEQPRPDSYLHGQRLRKRTATPKDEVRVLGRVRTAFNDKGVEVLAAPFLAEIFSECHTIRNVGLSLASWTARRSSVRHADEQREMANDLFQECVFRWIDGSWNYSLSNFKADLATEDPLLSLAFRLFGKHGRIKSVLHSEMKRVSTRKQTEKQYFESHVADLTPGALPSLGAAQGQDDQLMPEMKAPEPVALGDVLRLLQTPQMQQRLQALVDITAERGGFGKHSAVASEVFRLLYAKPRIPREVVAERCNVPLSFVYDMNKCEQKNGKAPYVVEQIRQHASDTTTYKEMMGLCPQELLERFRQHSMEWLTINLIEHLSDLGLYSPDTPDDEGSGD